MASDAVSSVARILDRVLQHQLFIVENGEEVKSLFHEVTSLQAILQNSSHNLESEIVKSAYEVRDLIETHIGEQIIRGNHLIFSSYESLDEAKDEICVVAQGQNLYRSPSKIVAELRRSKFFSPCFDIKVQLDIGYRMFGRGVTIIVGMAGIGKITLARRMFNSTTFGFQIRAWVTVSKSYNVKQILIDLLYSMGNCLKEMHQKTTEQLQDYLYTSIKGQRYLIVLDDLNDFQILDYLTRILRHTSTGEILVTTRLLENEAVLPESSHVHRLTIYSQNLHGKRLARNSRKQAESILKKVSLLHDMILENSSGKTIEEIKSLENQIINVEKRVKAFTEPRFMEYDLRFSPECLTKAKGKIDLVKTLIEKIDKEGEEKNMCCLSSAAASVPAAPVANITAEDFMEIKNKLIEESSKLEIVSLVGMGGIGKTTLATQVYDDKFFTQSFPIVLG